jgi:hypothetical protein
MTTTISLHAHPDDTDRLRVTGDEILDNAHVQLNIGATATVDLFLNGTPDEQWADLDKIIDGCLAAKRAIQRGAVALDPDPLTVQ